MKQGMKIIIGCAAWCCLVAIVSTVICAKLTDENKSVREENSKRLEEIAALSTEKARLSTENARLVSELRRLDELMEQGNRDDPPPESVDKPAWTSAGEFRIYHYCPCQKCTGHTEGSPNYGITSTGTVATEGRTVAVDPDVIPLGSEVLINGVVYIAEDTGVKGKAIDLFINSHEQASAMGTYTTDVSWR